jgi:hypothetical protein
MVHHCLKSTQQFDAAGKLVKTTVWDADGKHADTIIDPSTGKPFSSTLFDGKGLKTLDTQFNLDGSRNETSFDPVSGKATYKTLFKADGTVTQTTYDITNVKAWKEATAEYGKDGQARFRKSHQRQQHPHRQSVFPRYDQNQFQQRI